MAEKLSESAQQQQQQSTPQQQQQQQSQQQQQHAKDDDDDVTRVQSKLQELSVMFYDCIGVIQRDAPPSNRAPNKAHLVKDDNAKRTELAAKTPQFARDIIRCNREIDSMLAEMETRAKNTEGKEREMLENANFETVQAGEEMTEAIDDASKLLSSVRDLIAAREKEA